MIDIAAAPMPSSAPATMKLLIDTAAQRVLFAEAGKDVVDFILGLVAMPLGTVDRLLRAEGSEDGIGSLGSIASVHASVGKMDASCFQSKAARDALLFDPAAAAAAKPKPSPFGFGFGLPSAHAAAITAPPVFGVPAAAPSPAPAPNTSVNFNLRPAEPSNDGLPLYLYHCDACHASRLPQGSRGFVRDLGKYTVLDDLTVTPTSNASAVSSVALLKSLGVKDLDALEERTVNVGHEEAVAILKAALHSKTVLTDAFLSKGRAAPIISGHSIG